MQSPSQCRMPLSRADGVPEVVTPLWKGSGHEFTKARAVGTRHRWSAHLRRGVRTVARIAARVYGRPTRILGVRRHLRRARRNLPRKTRPARAPRSFLSGGPQHRRGVDWRGHRHAAATAARRYLGVRSGRRRNRQVLRATSRPTRTAIGHDPRPCRQGRTTDQEPSQPGTGTTGTDAEQRRQTDQDPSQPTPTPLSVPSAV